MEHLEIQFEKKRLGLMFGLCFCLFWVAFGLILLYDPINSNYLILFLLLFILIMGLVMLFCFNRWTKDEPAIIIDEEGIWDNSTALSIGKIEWGQIDKIEYNQQFKMIMIVVKDPQFFIRKAHNPFVKLIMWLNWKLDTSPIHLNDKLIKISTDKLMKELQNRWKKKLSFDDFSEHLIDDNV